MFCSIIKEITSIFKLFGILVQSSKTSEVFNFKSKCNRILILIKNTFLKVISFYLFRILKIVAWEKLENIFNKNSIDFTYF